jgi:predicted ATP-dependent protease
MAIKKLEAGAVGIPHFEVPAPGDCDVFALSSHKRARAALEFGLCVNEPGFNIFVLGADRSGRMTATIAFLERAMAKRAGPPDWIYLNNFAEPHRPKPFRLPAGEGRRFQARMASLLPQLREALSRAFGGAEYEKHVVAQNEQLQALIAERIEALRQEARKDRLDIAQTAQGFTIMPVDENGAPLAADDIPPERQETLEAKAKEINAKLRDVRRYAAQQQVKLTEELQDMNRQVAENAVGGLIDEISAGFAEQLELIEWLEEMRGDILDNLARVQPTKPGQPTAGDQVPERRYAVNLLVDHGNDERPLVVLEPNPTLESLFGYIEYRQAAGILETDFSMIRGGALHRANGGVLVLRAETIAANAALWKALKAALRDRQIELGNPLQAGVMPIAGAPKPQAIPLEVKVVLVGASNWYYTFFSVDPEFQTYFRIKADVDVDMEISRENLSCFAGLINAMAAKCGGLTCDEEASARLMGLASRWAADRCRLSSQFERIEDSLREAAQLLGPEDGSHITRAAIDRSITHRRSRNSRIEDRLHEQIAQGTVMIDVTGRVKGQVNALTVRDLGDHAFGTPSRVTARASIGRRGIINVERDIAMGGPIQQKGAMVVQGFLAGQFARKRPLSFNCSITFEQSYGGIEGDSASLAELIAIISEIAGLPVRQDLAITGSVNQRGESQAVGGVHHKVEGFFRSCADRGPLTGSQGVVIPAANESHLVLRDEVTEAIAEGRFHIWSVESIDEALELFLETPVGEAAADGSFPEDSIYGRVAAELERFDQVLRPGKGKAK